MIGGADDRLTIGYRVIRRAMFSGGDLKVAATNLARCNDMK
jgi:hypothetical protein